MTRTLNGCRYIVTKAAPGSPAWLVKEIGPDGFISRQRIYSRDEAYSAEQALQHFAAA